MNNWRGATPLPRIPPPDPGTDAESRRKDEVLRRVRACLTTEDAGGHVLITRRRKRALIREIDDALDTRERR